MQQGMILRIERISPNDGNGLRTVVFFKGCPLRCAWCSTPESQSAKPEWSYKQVKCLHCARCIQSCPQQALSVSADRTAVVRNRRKCINCFHCAEVCPVHAINIYGQVMTVEQIMQEIRKDQLFYFHSGGGVTVSGGDILLQADFAAELLRACREECINTTAELDMYGAYESVKTVLPYLCSYFADVKLMDPALHKKWTGVDNHTILDNLRRASKDFPEIPLFVRVPLIPGVNDTRQNIQATAEFCRSLPSCQSLEFLPYHRLGSASYQYLERLYQFRDLPAMTPEEACQRIGFLLDQKYPYVIKVAGMSPDCLRV